MKKILFIIGSLREGSFNRQLANEVAAWIGDRAQVKFLNYADVPNLNQDTEEPAPYQVARVRKEVEDADFCWIFTPEYNRSYPGHLKTLLDWLSRPHDDRDKANLEVVNKVFALTGAGGGVETAKAREKLGELIEFIGGRVFDVQVGVALSGESWQTGQLTLTDEQNEALKKQVEAVISSLK